MLLFATLYRRIYLKYYVGAALLHVYIFVFCIVLSQNKKFFEEKKNRKIKCKSNVFKSINSLLYYYLIYIYQRILYVEVL